MLKSFVIAASILISSSVFAQPKKEIVEIYNDYSVASSAARILQETVVIMNRIDKKYEYRVSSVTGGQGEASARALPRATHHHLHHHHRAHHLHSHAR